jgi:hypothetical protein
MANTTPQSLANHTRFDPLFHFFLLPLGLVAIVLSVVPRSWLCWLSDSS